MVVLHDTHGHSTACAWRVRKHVHGEHCAHGRSAACAWWCCRVRIPTRRGDAPPCTNMTTGLHAREAGRSSSTWLHATSVLSTPYFLCANEPNTPTSHTQVKTAQGHTNSLCQEPNREGHIKKRRLALLVSGTEPSRYEVNGRPALHARP